MALYDETLEFCIRHIENSEEYKNIRNASALIRIVGKGLGTTEFKTKQRKEWATLTLDDMKIPREAI